MYEIEIYTDGACSCNPGNGGWAAILKFGNNIKKISGAERNTTNNKMELTAVIKALSCLKVKCNVKIHSDSAYVINAFKCDWINKWIQNGWVSSSKKPVQNKDLWCQLLELINHHKVEFIKVKGHSDNYYNNECDRLAKFEITRLSNMH